MTFLPFATLLFLVKTPSLTLQLQNHLTTPQATPISISIPPMTSITVEKSKYDNLIRWLKSKDAIVNESIYIQESSRGGGYGAFVSTLIQSGDLLFTVPRSACITVDNVKADQQCGQVFQKIMEKAGPGGNTVVMAGYLAKEYLCWKDGDNYGPYLETLPWERGINAQEHVLFWNSDTIDAILKGSFCYREAKELQSEVSAHVIARD